jgi:hypothetical protein
MVTKYEVKEDIQPGPGARPIRVHYTRQVPEQYYDLAKVANSHISEVSAIQFETAKMATLPEVAIFQQKTLLNCADSTLTSTINLSITGTQGWSVTKTRGITTTIGGSISGSFGLPKVGTLGASVSWNQALNVSTSTTEQHQETVSRMMSDTITLQAGKAAKITLLATQVSVEVPYRATVTVDGDLIGNSAGLIKASQLLSKDERTFSIDGVLHVNNVSQGTVRSDTLNGRAGCEGNTGIVEIGGSEQQSSVDVNNLGASLKNSFKALPLNAKSLTAGKADKAAISDGDPTIGPADGTSYTVLFTTQVAKPSPAQCGFGDFGNPLTGLYTVETREYRTYVNGTLVSDRMENVETFVMCSGL